MRRSLIRKMTLIALVFFAWLLVSGWFTIQNIATNRSTIRQLTEHTLQRDHASNALAHALDQAITEASAFGHTRAPKDRADARDALAAAATQLLVLRQLTDKVTLAPALHTAYTDLYTHQQAVYTTIQQHFAALEQAVDADNSTIISRSLSELERNEAALKQTNDHVNKLLAQELSTAKSSINNVMLRSLYMGVGGLGLFGVAIIGVVLQLRQRIVRPINALVMAANAFASGDFTQSVRVTSHDEIGGLQQAFNQMAHTLQSQQAVRKAFEDELAHVAFHDSLSNLPNRALFMDRLQQALSDAKRQKHAVAVLFLDLDNFKVINDSLGHQTGDQLLRAVAERLLLCIRPDDAIARLGGDEFTILLENIGGVDDAIRVAERIQERLQAPVTLGKREIVTTASIGIAMSTPGHDIPDDLLRDADLGMYRAKNGGKARYAVFDQSMNTRAMERLELESDLRRGLERGEFRVHYQPVVQLQTGAIIGVEALVRWQHPERGLVPPLKFIPLAEETGLILPLGQWVLEEACRQMRVWQQHNPRNPPLFVSVNLSSRQFQHPRIVDDIARVLHSTGLAPHSLELEITETIVMENGESTLAVLRQLKALGIQLAIDDFGTGYSSLAYLKRFPIDTLKIDRSFVDQLEHDPEDLAIVRAIVMLAKTLNLMVTGEGIETPAQSSHLRSLGCGQGQGYYFAKPLTSEGITALLNQGHLNTLGIATSISAVTTLAAEPANV